MRRIPCVAKADFYAETWHGIQNILFQLQLTFTLSHYTDITHCVLCVRCQGVLYCGAESLVVA